MLFRLTQIKPGHNLKLHILVSMATPLHGSPPFAGAGFVQPRMRFWKPSPHVFEQGDHADQADQLPFTNHDSQDKTKIL